MLDQIARPAQGVEDLRHGMDVLNHMREKTSDLQTDTETSWALWMIRIFGPEYYAVNWRDTSRSHDLTLVTDIMADVIFRRESRKPQEETTDSSTYEDDD